MQNEHRKKWKELDFENKLYGQKHQAIISSALFLKDHYSGDASSDEGFSQEYRSINNCIRHSYGQPLIRIDALPSKILFSR